MDETIVPARTYILIGIILVVLAVLTTVLAFVDLRGWNTTVALLIAAVKAVLIGLFFMHARYNSGVMRLAALAALFWLGILIFGTLSDYMTRGWLPVPGK